eukprot:UN30894
MEPHSKRSKNNDGKISTRFTVPEDVQVDPDQSMNQSMQGGNISNMSILGSGVNQDDTMDKDMKIKPGQFTLDFADEDDKYKISDKIEKGDKVEKNSFTFAPKSSKSDDKEPEGAQFLFGSTDQNESSNLFDKNDNKSEVKSFNFDTDAVDPIKLGLDNAETASAPSIYYR